MEEPKAWQGWPGTPVPIGKGQKQPWEEPQCPAPALRPAPCTARDSYSGDSSTGKGGSRQQPAVGNAGQDVGPLAKRNGAPLAMVVGVGDGLPAATLEPSGAFRSLPEPSEASSTVGSSPSSTLPTAQPPELHAPLSLRSPPDPTPDPRAPPFLCPKGLFSSCLPQLLPCPPFSSGLSPDGGPSRKPSPHVPQGRVPRLSTLPALSPRCGLRYREGQGAGLSTILSPARPGDN